MPKAITRVLLLTVLVLAFAGASLAAPTSGPTEPPVLPFYPQSGLPWQDLYFANFVDLDPGPSTLDWSCGTQTYDGHTGEDSIIRSFQEKRIGVPVFAAVDGIVIEVSDLLPDEHVERTMTPVDNHVILSSLGRHVRTIYGHLRKGVLVRQGQRIVAGQQLGWTASSGHSSWPHLHFTIKLDLTVYEPFAGPCRAGRATGAPSPRCRPRLTCATSPSLASRSAGAVTRRGTRRSARGPSRQACATSTSAPSSGSSTVARCRSRSRAPTAVSPSTRSATCRSRATAPPG